MTISEQHHYASRYCLIGVVRITALRCFRPAFRLIRLAEPSKKFRRSGSEPNAKLV